MSRAVYLTRYERALEGWRRSLVSELLGVLALIAAALAALGGGVDSTAGRAALWVALATAVARLPLVVLRLVQLRRKRAEAG